MTDDEPTVSGEFHDEDALVAPGVLLGLGHRLCDGGRDSDEAVDLLAGERHLDRQSSHPTSGGSGGVIARHLDVRLRVVVVVVEPVGPEQHRSGRCGSWPLPSSGRP